MMIRVLVLVLIYSVVRSAEYQITKKKGDDYISYSSDPRCPKFRGNKSVVTYASDWNTHYDTYDGDPYFQKHTSTNLRNGPDPGYSSNGRGSSENSGVSLVFVFDSTSSMYDDLQQAREGAKKIFNATLALSDQRIHNFVLVQFKDPGKLSFIKK